MVNDPFRTQEFLFHRATIDRIDYFLGKGKISCKKGGKGISFTEGIPIIPGHGDSAIVFRREWLDNQSCESKKIDYSDHNMIEEYRVLGHPSKGRQEFIDQLTDEKKLREALGNLDFQIKMKIDYNIEYYRNLSDEEIQQMLLDQYSTWENEVIALSDELTFEKNDIVAIIPFYRFYLEHFESLRDYEEKLIFTDDLFRYGEQAIELGMKSNRAFAVSEGKILFAKEDDGELHEHMERIIRANQLFEQLKSKGFQRSASFVQNMNAFHIACSLIGNKEEYDSILEILPEHMFPPPPDFLTGLLSRLYLLPNNQFKCDFIDHLSSRLILSEPELSLTDNFYISEIENRLD
jgi:hypothetical protein